MSLSLILSISALIKKERLANIFPEKKNIYGCMVIVLKATQLNEQFKYAFLNCTCRKPVNVILQYPCPDLCLATSVIQMYG